MTSTVKQAGVAVCLAVAVAAAPAGRSAAAEPCQRTVAISQQVTTGESAGTLTFEVRSTGCAAAGSVAYAGTAGTAQPAADFRLPNGTLRWDAGDTAVRSITATIADDRVREATLEDLTVRLTAPSAGVAVLHGTGNGRIIDDDGPGPSWVLDDGTVPMLGHGYFCANPPPEPPEPPKPLTLVWQTGDGTAVAGVDYLAVTDRVQTLPAGATRIELDLTLLPRPAGTPSRWFTVRIVAVSAGTVVDAVAVVTLDGS
jgi:hypothetical protein